MMATMAERRQILDRRGKASGNISNQISSKSMNAADWIAMTLLILGGVNWGLVGLFNYDVVATFLGNMSPISRLIYVVVGLAALYSIYTASKMGRHSE